jgi:arsenite methyltransferase
MTTYEHVARGPHAAYHFHRGPEYAATFLCYDRKELAALPATATVRFAGVGNPVAIGPVRAGETVLDHACGAGLSNDGPRYGEPPALSLEAGRANAR